MKRKDRVKELIRFLKLFPVVEGIMKEFEKDIFKKSKRNIEKQGDHDELGYL